VRWGGARASLTHLTFELNHSHLKLVHSLGLICLSAHSNISIC
jgi:hypothetical protein